MPGLHAETPKPFWQGSSMPQPRATKAFSPKGAALVVLTPQRREAAGCKPGLAAQCWAQGGQRNLSELPPGLEMQARPFGSTTAALPTTFSKFSTNPSRCPPALTTYVYRLKAAREEPRWFCF